MMTWLSFAVPQIGKSTGRVISPDSGISLPNNLAVIIPLEGGHLRALLPDACGRITAVKRKFHEKHLRKCRFRRKYSRHEAKNPA